MTKFSLGDVRITTRVKEDDLGDALFSTLHEAGHAMTDHSMMGHGMMMGSAHSGHDGGAMQMGASGYADGSGTSRQPAASGAMHGLHLATGDWMVMLHGYAFANWTDQDGPRGDTEAFVASMAMVTAAGILETARAETVDVGGWVRLTVGLSQMPRAS